MSALRTALALVVAIGLIVGALAVRSGMEDRDGPVASGSDGTGEESAQVPADQLRVACADVLGAACPAGSVRLDVPGLLSAFSTRPLAHDVLVGPRVLVEMVAAAPGAVTAFTDPTAVLATSPLVLAVTTARDEAVADACGAAVTWSCAASLVTEGTIRPSFADPDEDIVGLSALAALTGGHLGAPDYSANQLSGSSFIAFLDAVGRVDASPTPTQQLIQFGGARNDAAIELEATGERTATTSAQLVPDLYWPTPLAVIDVVAAGVTGTDAEAVADAVAGTSESLQAAGWRAPDGQPVGAGPPLDLDADGLPGGGTLFALRERR